jgi:hypothetical protein
MANLTVVAAEVAAVKIIDSFIIPRSEAVPVGGFGRVDSNARLVLGNASAAGELGLRRGIVFELLSDNVRVMAQGLLDLGTALDGLAIGDEVFISDDDGLLADAAGTVSCVAGIVVPGLGEVTADNLLYVDLNKAPAN